MSSRQVSWYRGRELLEPELRRWLAIQTARAWAEEVYVLMAKTAARRGTA